jgi:hypothetical protein
MLHLGAIDFFGPSPVELIEGLDHGKTRRGNAPGDAAVVPSLALSFNEPPEIFEMSPLLTRALIGKDLMIFLKEGQAEPGQLFGEAKFFVIHGED